MKENNLTFKSLQEHEEVISDTYKLAPELDKAYKAILKSVRRGGTIFLCGNGGSAADSQHIAAELIGRFKFNRNPIKALALTTDTSIITAISNDYDYKKIFTRQLQALVQKNDIVIAISTSGNSKNIIELLKLAKRKKIKTISFLGNKGGKSKSLSNISLIVPSNSTARIQEVHILLGHIICERLEKEMFKK